MNNDHIFNYIEKGKVFHINEKTVNNFYKSTIKQFLLKCLEHGMPNIFYSKKFLLIYLNLRVKKSAKMYHK